MIKAKIEIKLILLSHNILLLQNLFLVAERISVRQIIVLYMRHWAICMYVYIYIYMSAKDFGLSIVGLKLNCTAACVLCCMVYHYIQWSLSSIL